MRSGDHSTSRESSKRRFDISCNRVQILCRMHSQDVQYMIGYSSYTSSLLLTKLFTSPSTGSSWTLSCFPKYQHFIQPSAYSSSRYANRELIDNSIDSHYDSLKTQTMEWDSRSDISRLDHRDHIGFGLGQRDVRQNAGRCVLHVHVYFQGGHNWSRRRTPSRFRNMICAVNYHLLLSLPTLIV